jgi:hypothetical protein
MVFHILVPDSSDLPRLSRCPDIIFFEESTSEWITICKM